MSNTIANAYIAGTWHLLRDRPTPGVAKGDTLIGDEWLPFFFLAGVAQACMRDPELAGDVLASAAGLCGGVWGGQRNSQPPCYYSGLVQALRSAWHVASTSHATLADRLRHVVISRCTYITDRPTGRFALFSGGWDQQHHSPEEEDEDEDADADVSAVSTLICPEGLGTNCVARGKVNECPGTLSPSSPPHNPRRSA